MTGTYIYSAPWSKVNWIFTVGIAILVFIFIPLQIFTNVAAQPLTLLLLAVPMLMLVCLFFAPFDYAIAKGYVTVNRIGKNIRIPIKTITSTRYIRRCDLGCMIRTFGVGGFFGSYGKFRSSKLGPMDAYITNSKNLVLIEYSDNKKILLSPDKPQEFIEKINSYK